MVHSGVADFAAYIEQSNPERKLIFDVNAADQKSKAKIYRDLSPITNVNRVKAPVLVQTGVDDKQVPSSQSDLLVTALKQQGKPVEYLKFEDEGHWIHKLPNRIKSIKKEVEFFASHL